MNRTVLKALLLSRFEAFKYSLFANTRKKRKNGLVQSKRGTMILYSLLFIYAAVCIGIMMFGIFSEIAEPYHMLGLDWLYFAMYVLMDFGFMFIGTVFTAKAQIFEAKDNDLLLSMPIPTRYILLSRMTFLLCLNLLFGFFVTAPALAAWLINVNVDAAQIIIFLVIALLLPLFTVAVSSLFGWFLSLVTRRVRNKSMLTTVCSLAFFGFYFYFVGNMNKMITNLAANGAVISSKLGAVAPLYWMGRSIGSIDFKYLLYSVLFLIVPFIACCYILSITLIKTITTQHGIAKVVYHERKAEQKTPFSALYRRELSMLLSSAMYLMNCTMGAIMTFAAGIIIIFVKDKFNMLFSLGVMPPELLIGIFVLVICMVGSMCNINSASISMEGNKLWISKSIPVKSSAILNAKLLLQQTFMTPSILMVSIAITVVAKPDLLNALVIFIFPQIFALLINLMDLSLNLKFPLLDWTNEAQACKTGLSVFLAIFVPWGFVLAFGAAGWFMFEKIPVWAIFGIFAVVLLAASAILYRWIMRRGTGIYDNL